jgi:predicted permease
MWNTRILLPGETESSNSENLANLEKVRENYFATMEIPLQRGRLFTPQDDARAPAVGIVNQAFVRKYFPDKEILGQRITDQNDKRPLEIVGVVADTKYASQRGEIEPLLYTPWRQEAQNIGGVSFALRTVGEPTALAHSVREAVRAIDANLPVNEIRTQRAQSDEILAQERLYARLLSFFGLLALALAAIGLSGVLAYAVAQRTQEIGIRMALGAQTRDVLRLVISQGMKLVLLGVVLGGAAGYVLKRWITSDAHDRRSWQHQLTEALYDVQFTDPLTFGVIAALLLSVALLACWLPARRAARVDPMIALRCD